MVYTLENVIKHIRKLPNVGFKLLQKNVKKIIPLDIKMVLFLLISARILEVEYDIALEKGGDVVFHLAKVQGSGLNLALLDDNYWESIDTF